MPRKVDAVPQRENTNWEGAFRVPSFARWPGRIKPGQISNEIVSGLDWMPTLMAAVRDPDIKQAPGRLFLVVDRWRPSR